MNSNEFLDDFTWSQQLKSNENMILIIKAINDYVPMSSRQASRETLTPVLENVFALPWSLENIVMDFLTLCYDISLADKSMFALTCQFTPFTGQLKVHCLSKHLYVPKHLKLQVYNDEEYDDSFAISNQAENVSCFLKKEDNDQEESEKNIAIQFDMNKRKDETLEEFLSNMNDTVRELNSTYELWCSGTIGVQDSNQVLKYSSSHVIDDTSTFVNVISKCCHIISHCPNDYGSLETLHSVLEQMLLLV